jgi:23S rRNA pseudouridine1911/1915/1917 synthase
MRLDLAVARAFGLSRRAARDAVRAGRIDANGATVDEPGLDVETDTKLELHANRPAKRRVRTRLTVLYEDDDVVIVDKPAGLLTVPTEAREKDTLWSRVLLYLQHRYGGRPYAGIVHRLDKDTSGAVAFARNRAALHFLQDRFREHSIDREYVAIVAGNPPDDGFYDAALVREEGRRRHVARPGQEGRRAVTHFRTLERLPEASLVAIRLETGRTHQIRVHFSAAGHPVLGDRVYGSRDAESEAPRQMLHARTLGFAHPSTGRRVFAEAEQPDDFTATLEALRQHKRKRPDALQRRTETKRPDALQRRAVDQQKKRKSIARRER